MIVFFSSRRRHTRCSRDWSSDVCSSDLHHSNALSFLMIPVIVVCIYLAIIAVIGSIAFRKGRQNTEDFFLASRTDRKSTRLNSSHGYISYAVFCLKKKKKTLNK